MIDGILTRRPPPKNYYGYTYVRGANMTILKLRSVGALTGVVIPKEMLARLNVAKGDVLYAVETPDVGYRLTPYDPDFAGKMDKVDEIMRRYRNTLHALAK
jgi:putative addiction module antidote